MKQKLIVDVLSNLISAEVDPVGLRELEIYIDNDANLYERYKLPIFKALSMKKKKQIYKPELATKAFNTLVDVGAKKYAKEFANPAEWNMIFKSETRKQLAKRYVSEFEEAYKNKKYDFMD